MLICTILWTMGSAIPCKIFLVKYWVIHHQTSPYQKITLFSNTKLTFIPKVNMVRIILANMANTSCHTALPTGAKAFVS